MLIDLAAQVGIQLRKVSSTRGGEYKGPCPACGGTDRFYAQPQANNQKGYYRCRQCNIKGDSIQFCKDFIGLSFKEALERVGDSQSFKYSLHPFIHSQSASAICSNAWKEKAEEFCEASHQNLVQDNNAIVFIKNKYGFTMDTIRQYQVGWNPRKIFFPKSEWGISGSTKKLCLPKGPVFACRHKGEIFKLKIRDFEWKEGNLYGKYREVEGSSNRTAIFGYLTNQTIVILESELDAMLLVQEIGEFCTCVALGGATKKPDSDTAAWLKNKPLILYSLDFDAAGKEQYGYWRSTYANLKAWPSETRKCPADSFIFDGVNLKKWFEAGIQYYTQEKS